MAPLTVSLVLYRPEPALLRATLAALEVASRRADLQPDLFLIDNGGSAEALAGLELPVGWTVHHISGHGNVETAVSAIKRGAYDYIEKPFKADRLVLIAERALESSRLKREIRDLQIRSDRQEGVVGGHAGFGGQHLQAGAAAVPAGGQQIQQPVHQRGNCGEAGAAVAIAAHQQQGRLGRCGGRSLRRPDRMHRPAVGQGAHVR